MPMMPFSGVRISWLAIARKRDLARLAASAWSRACASARSLSVRSVTSRPTHCSSAGSPASLRTSPSRQAIQRAPNGPAIFWSWIRVPSRFERGVALFEHGEFEGGADQRVAVRLRQFAIGVVGEGDAAIGVAQHDQVALRFEQAAGALLGLLQFPVPVGHRFVVHDDLAHLLAQHAEAEAHGGEPDAGQREQEGDADRKGVRVIAGILGPRACDEPIGAAEGGGEHHEGADGEDEPGMAAGEAAKKQFDPERPPHRQ